MKQTATIEEIIAKIIDIDRLPSYEEVLYAIREMSDVINSYKPLTSHDYSRLWPEWFKTKGIFTILTQEFVDELYREMMKRRLAGVPVIEVGAGKGKLAYQLRKRGVDIIGTDSYSQEMERDENLVERCSHTEALQRHIPRLVVASWLPANPEIGNDVLHFPTVDYFIDIGEGRGGATWLTQGYKNEDFTIKYLNSVALYAIATSDYFALTSTGIIKLVEHTQVRLWKRKGAPMSIDHRFD